MASTLPVWSFYRVEETDFSYQCLIAGQCPSLKGRTLCEYLQKMDAREYEVIHSEFQQYETIDNKYFYHTILSIASIALAVILGLAAWFFGSVIPLYPASALLYAGISVAIPTIGDVREIDNKISQARLARLQLKIKDIAREIEKPSTNAEDIEQLNLALYYFKIQSE